MSSRILAENRLSLPVFFLEDIDEIPDQKA